MARPLDENQGPSQVHGQSPWLMCEVALRGPLISLEVQNGRWGLLRL